LRSRFLSFFVLAFSAARALSNPIDDVNELRTKGCHGNPAVPAALKPSRDLNDAAERMSRGARLRDALHEIQYRPLRSASVRIRSGRSRVAPLLKERFCDEATDPVMREIGYAAGKGTVLVIVATRFEPPGPADAAAVSAAILKLTNAARAQPRRCGAQQFGSAPPVRLSSVLGRAALGHAEDMASHSRMSHEGSDGSTPAKRVRAAGYDWSFVAENVAMGQADAESVMTTWIESPGHCANIMNPSFTELGVAYSMNPESEAGLYWAMELATARR
jgi:uncharacterized protein YkwD